MAAEAEEQARRLTAQAREAQAIFESLEAVARGRYPLRARGGGAGQQGRDRAEHRGRVRKGGSAAAFGGVVGQEEERRDHRAPDPR
mmetsp:Transcript_23797/g.58902  ORF Transcript_23797/g.58902 Transcript_23797/m.58902 type:complete len:86 (+) Transcript_23797:201-458(+)